MNIYESYDDWFKQQAQDALCSGELVPSSEVEDMFKMKRKATKERQQNKGELMNVKDQRINIKDQHWVNKYYWILNHPLDRDMNNHEVATIVHGWGNEIEVSPQTVNPLTKEIDQDESKNTEVAFWIEFSYYDRVSEEDREWFNDDVVSFHDWEMDCGAETYEGAIELLFNMIYDKYGDYEHEF